MCSRMRNPASTLDVRFSDQRAVPIDRNKTRRLIETAELFWICNVRADGRPHVTPLVAVWLDGAMHFCTAARRHRRQLRTTARTGPPGIRPA
jgi:Pyridoxamine 5'-phosphate oxidase